MKLPQRYRKGHDTRQSEEKRTPQQKQNIRFDWFMSLLSSWLVGGLFADGWAHAHISALETFFTPWHALFYSGFLAVASILLVTALRNRLRGLPWSSVLPHTYMLSSYGAGIFAIGGIGDLFWHLFFGVEVGIEALLSPTHLLLACGIALIVSGPFRSAWQHSSRRSLLAWKALFPMLLSLTLFLSLCTFLTEFSHPFVTVLPAKNASRFTHYGVVTMQNFGVALGITGIELHTALLMGVVLLIMRRWILPFGAFTFVFTVHMTLMVALNDNILLLPAAVLTGIAADILAQWFKPADTRLIKLRLFAFMVPVSLFLFYFLGIFLLWGSWWSIHLWLGAVALSGVVGLLLSYVAVPPQVDTDADGILIYHKSLCKIVTGEAQEGSFLLERALQNPNTDLELDS